MGLSYTFEVKKQILIVRLYGELDHHEAESLRDEWKRLMYENEVKHSIVNLQDLHFMDSSGLGVILGRYKETLQLGGEMIVCSVTPSIKRLFEMSGIYKIIQVKENEMNALESLGVAS